MIFNLKYSTQSNHLLIITLYIIFIIGTFLSTTAAFGLTNDSQDTKEEQIKTSNEIRILKNNTETQIANLQHQITALEENLIVYNHRLLELESVQYVNQIIAIIAVVAIILIAMIIFFNRSNLDRHTRRSANSQEDEGTAIRSDNEP